MARLNGCDIRRPVAEIEATSDRSFEIVVFDLCAWCTVNLSARHGFCTDTEGGRFSTFAINGNHVVNGDGA